MRDTYAQRWLVGNLSTIYVPQLQVGTTPACCSDHQSFDQQGFVSTWVFERNGPMCAFLFAFIHGFSRANRRLDSRDIVLIRSEQAIPELRWLNMLIPCLRCA